VAGSSAEETPGGCGFVGTWHNHGESQWVNTISDLMNVSHYPVMPMIGSAGCQSPQLASMAPAARAVVEDFAYASFLLAADGRRQMLGVVPYRLRDPQDHSHPQRPRLAMYLHPRYFFPLGAALQTSPTLEGYRISGCTYARQFELALALVNPSQNCSEVTVRLPGGSKPWYDPQSASPRAPITTVAMPAQHGRILLARPLLDSGDHLGRYGMQ
jgi:hypothetical protein